MQKVNQILKKYDLKPHRYVKYGKAVLVDTDEGKFIVKEKKYDNEYIYRYLKSRNFNYYPKRLYEDEDEYEITEYIEEVETPLEQKIVDMIDIMSLLHNKTTHYKEVDIADYKKIYEDIDNNINYLNSYYNDVITIIENKVYMSPSEYLLARNISKIFASLNYAKAELEKWYELVNEKRKQRLVVLHNNLELSHFIRNDSSYLINWSKSKIDIPIFDLYKLYKKHVLDFDFEELLKYYERSYPLLADERKLFFILIALPNKIEFDKSEYIMCDVISKEIDTIIKTENLISPYHLKDGK